MFTMMETERQVLPEVKWVQSVEFGECSVRITDVAHKELQLSYSEIIMAYIEISDKETGSAYRLRFIDITEDIDGNVILCDCHNRRFELKTEQTEKKAGYILKQLALRAPYIIMDSQDWLEEKDEEDFAEAKRMVSLRRELPDKEIGWIPFKYL